MRRGTCKQQQSHGSVDGLDKHNAASSKRSHRGGGGDGTAQGVAPPTASHPSGMAGTIATASPPAGATCRLLAGAPR